MRYFRGADVQMDFGAKMGIIQINRQKSPNNKIHLTKRGEVFRLYYVSCLRCFALIPHPLFASDLGVLHQMIRTNYYVNF